MSGGPVVAAARSDLFDDAAGFDDALELMRQGRACAFDYGIPARVTPGAWWPQKLLVRRRLGGEPVGGVRLGRGWVGYFVLHPWRRQGYASEALEAALAAVGGLLPEPRITAAVLRSNAASRRVLETCGFQFDGMTVLPWGDSGTRQSVLRYVRLAG